jgi:hypothetical protein
VRRLAVYTGTREANELDILDKLIIDTPIIKVPSYCIVVAHEPSCPFVAFDVTTLVDILLD